MRLLAAALLAILPLTACSQQPADPTVVTADEDRQLNEAAASLAANAVAPDDPEDNAQ